MEPAVSEQSEIGLDFLAERTFLRHVGAAYLSLLLTGNMIRVTTE
jgi:hypothetical protein